MTVLYSFWVSHFSEKARWCLDYEGVEYQERHLLPGLHAFTTRKLARKQQVPVFVHEGNVVQGSSAIIDAIPRLFGKCRLQPWLDQSGAPLPEQRSAQEKSAALEKLADECFGKAIQAFGYDAILGDRKCTVGLWGYGGPWWTPAFYALSYPLLVRFIRAQYCRNADNVRRARERFLAALLTTDQILTDQPYLLGDEPSRADITVAALLSPVVRPQEHPMSRPEYPAELSDFISSLEGRPTWTFALRMYQQHRNQYHPLV